MDIIIFSDHHETANGIKKLLTLLGFSTSCQNYSEKLPDLKHYKLAVLDISNLKASLTLPLDFCKKLNKQKRPVLLVLGYRQSYFLYETKLAYDDFVFFEQLDHELEHRVNRILPKRNLQSPSSNITISGLILNTDKYQLVVDKNLIELTYKEYQLLKLLIQHKNKAFSRSKLLSIIWEYDYYGGSRTVDVHIRRLRAKLPSPYNLMLKTIRNVGYMFSPDLT